MRRATIAYVKAYIEEIIKRPPRQMSVGAAPCSYKSPRYDLPLHIATLVVTYSVDCDWEQGCCYYAGILLLKTFRMALGEKKERSLVKVLSLPRLRSTGGSPVRLR
jgi:hypothetical protein